jgi:hypothetical protein
MMGPNDRYRWSQHQIDAGYQELASLSRRTADRLSAQAIPESELKGTTTTRIPEVKGFMGYGSKPAYSETQRLSAPPRRLACLATLHVPQLVQVRLGVASSQAQRD